MAESLIYIDLPNIKDDTLVTIAFSYGFLNETNALFGIGHLAEHCICAQIKKELKPKDAWGHIDDGELVIHILLNKADATLFLERGVMETLRELADAIAPADIKKESLRMRSEISERYGGAQSLFSEYVKSKLIVEPKRMARRRIDQLTNISKFSSRELKAAFKAIFSAERMIFVGMRGNKGTSNPVVKPFNPFPDFKFTDKKQIKGPADKKRHLFIAAFQAPGLCEPLHENLALSFLSQEIYQRFRESAREQGAYEPFSQHRVNRDFGIMWFGMYSFAKISDSIQTSFSAAIKDVLSDKAMKSRLEAFKRAKITEVKKDWSDDFERHDWIVEDYINYGKVEGLDYALREIKKISTETVRKVGKRVLGGEKRMYMIRS